MMTPYRAKAIAIVTTLALVVSGAFAPAVPAQTAAPDVARMEQLIQSRVADRSFMGAVLVARGDNLIDIFVEIIAYKLQCGGVVI